MNIRCDTSPLFERLKQWRARIADDEELFAAVEELVKKEEFIADLFVIDGIGHSRRDPSLEVAASELFEKVDAAIWNRDIAQIIDLGGQYA